MIKLFTDTSADLSEDYLKEHPGIEVLKLKTSLYGEKLEDISNQKFYELLATLKNEFPKTSQLSPEEFYNAFKKHINDEILYIGIGSNFSGCINSAKIAIQILSEECCINNIHIFDSNSVTVKQGLLVDCAYRMIQEGFSINQIINKLNEITNEIVFSFFIDDLKYIYAGGRVSKTSMTFGNMLNIKPILTIKNNVASIKTKIRGTKKAVEFLANEINNLEIKKLFIGRCENSDLFKDFISRIKIPYTMFEIGPVMATHGGPECFGFAALVK